MTRKEAVNWLINIMADIGKAEHRELWHYEQALSEIRELLEAQPEVIACGSGELIVDATGDLVSRAAAIDTAIEAADKWDGGYSSEREGIIRKFFDKLPAAQPDHTADSGKKVCVDTISRQAAIDCVTYDVEHTIECLKALSSAQPERKKGQWLRYGEDGYPNNEDTVFWQCDQCLEQYTGRTKRIPNFCPNCGADMRGGDSE